MSKEKEIVDEMIRSTILSDEEVVEIWEKFDPEKPIPLVDMLSVVTKKQQDRILSHPAIRLAVEKSLPTDYLGGG